MRHHIRTIVFLLLTLFTAGGAYAVPLSSLFNGGSITAGDKLFDSWQLISYTASDPARNFNAGNLDVQPLADGGLNPGPGLRFSVSNSELTVSGDGLYAFVDLWLGFRVSVLDPALRITDNSLAYSNGGAYWAATLDGSYDAGSYIRETVGSGPAQDDLGSKSIEFSVFGDPQTSISEIAASTSFSPQSEIWITKNLLVWAADTSDSAGIFGFDQRFSQSNVVPEPSTIALMALGLVGVVAARRRKRN